MIEKKKYLSRATAQKRLGCTKNEFRELLENGTISFERKESGGFLIDAESVNDFIEKRASNNNTALCNRVRQLEARVELLEDLLERNGITIPDSLLQPKPGDATFVSKYPLLHEIPFSGRAHHVFREGGVTTVEQLVGMKSGDLMKIHGCGKKTINEVRNYLASQGLSFEL